MSKYFKYGLAFCLLGVVLAILLWPESTKNKELSDGKTQPRVSLNNESSDQENPGNIPPVKDSLSAEQLRQIEKENEQTKQEKMKELLRRDYSTPIDFWGKVVDLEGNPIVGVMAEIVVDEHGGSKKYVVFSDEKGLFDLLEKKGARIRVKVSLDGYAPTADEKIGTNVSSRTIYYAEQAMPAFAPPTQNNPQIFVLRKKNQLANLAHFEKDHVPVDTLGTPQKIELTIAGRTIEIEVRCWSSCPVPFTYDKYDWRAEIRVAGGKLRSITEFDPVTAPMDGYQPIFKVEMPKDTEETWKATSIKHRDFWIKFDDGSFSKARIEVKTGRTHEVDAELWYNLDATNNFEQ